MKTAKPSPPPHRISWFKWGCLSFVAMVLLLALGIWIFFNWQRQRWTDSRPVRVKPVSEPDNHPPDGAKLYRETRLALEKGGPADLSFDTRQLNAMLTQMPELQAAGYPMALRLQDDKVFSQISFPLHGIPGFEGRFLNGDFVFTVAIHQGIPQITLLSGTIRGRPVPERFLRQVNQIASRQLLRRLENQVDLNRVESLQIEKNRLNIRLRGKNR